MPRLPRIASSRLRCRVLPPLGTACDHPTVVLGKIYTACGNCHGPLQLIFDSNRWRKYLGYSAGQPQVPKDIAFFVISLASTDNDSRHLQRPDLDLTSYVVVLVEERGEAAQEYVRDDPDAPHIHLLAVRPPF